MIRHKEGFMSKCSLLALAVLLLPVGTMAGTRASDPQASAPVLLADSTSSDLSVQNFQVGRQQAFDAGNDDDICYKIRAYIFKRDDDHAPEFVRSTTCGPRKPHAKDATWPKAKLVPAN